MKVVGIRHLQTVEIKIRGLPYANLPNQWQVSFPRQGVFKEQTRRDKTRYASGRANNKNRKQQ
jgi:hypothetical protein